MFKDPIHRFFSAVIILLLTTMGPAFAHQVSLSTEESTLYELLESYRAENGLAGIPLSVSLTHTAQTHARDLADHFAFGTSCNMHSWSGNGPWSECCYTEDHAQARCMWEKPGELTDYPDNGYEIAFGGPGGYIATAEAAMEGWKGSHGHNDVMLSNGTWANIPWKAVGVGLHKGFAVIWFGGVTDPAGNPLEPVSTPSTSEEKVDALLNRLEIDFPDILSPATISRTETYQGESIRIRRYYTPSNAILALYQNDIWYSLHGEVKRFSTLEEANQLLCGGTCW